MAAKQKGKATVAPAIIAIPEVNVKDLNKIVAFADEERRSHAAMIETERALSVLVQTADEIAQQAGDIPTAEFSGSPIEKERRAKKVNKIVEALEKVRASVSELATA